MGRVLTAKTAVFVELQPVGVVFLIFKRVVIALLALGAGKGDFYSHFGTSIYTSLSRRMNL